MAFTGQKTASTYRSAVVRGTHEFHIDGCSDRKRFSSVTSSSSIKSGSFLAGGHNWALACSFDNEGHLVSITLELLGTRAKDFFATAGIRIEDPLGEWPTAVWQSDAMRFQANRTWKLSVPDAYHGHESGYVRDDRLTIQCTVDVLEEYSPKASVETRNCFASVVPPPTIAQDLHKLLFVDESESGSRSDCEERRRRCMRPDVTFVVEENEIQAHKLLLAMRSPVFAAEFRWHTNDNATSTLLSIDDMSASTFRAMLRFIYTDELPIKSSNDTTQRACKEKYASRRREAMARDLLVAADRYDLERLRLMCQNILLESIDASTVMGTLLLVRGRHTCCQLEDSCIEYIASDPNVYAAVMSTEEYQELKNSCSPLIIEIVERVAMHNGARNSSDGINHGLPNKTWSAYNASVHVTKQPYTSTSIPTTRVTIMVPPSSIALQLEQLLVGQQGSDLSFLVEGCEIRAHALVIAARSPILYETVAAAAGDNNDDLRVASIDGIKATVFKAVLHFVYTDDLPTLGSTVVAEDVLAAACRFFCCHNMFHRWSDIGKDVVAVAGIRMEDPLVQW
ncbi:hypothetical protein QYE76_049618 [Lolium multiflorum]|uniref:BTB domain-containing protein n=1 Tax=Lolium multiflorum TaxID=4521 RepID=A0AAD8SPH0_LOLMU|nr:hypothetical protein QYE76_049618 [Lolium multiflorum]